MARDRWTEVRQRLFGQWRARTLVLAIALIAVAAHAKALVRGWGTVIEHVAQVRAAAAAKHLGALHEQVESRVIPRGGPNPSGLKTGGMTCGEE